MKILVLSASVGSGHTRAAQALTAALSQFCEVQHVDVLDLANSVFRKMYGDGYIGLAESAPHLLGYLYEKLDRPSGSDGLRRAVQRLALRGFGAFLEDKAPDLVVNTHFLPAELIAQLPIAPRQAVAVTDFEAHRMWAQPAERFFAASEEAKAALRHWGVDGERVSVTGIPIDPAFGRCWSKRRSRALWGLDERPVILLLGGGGGLGRMEETLESLLSLERPCQIIAVAGRGRLEAPAVPERHALRLLGFTDKVPELMAVSDLLVSKPGGLTTSEALAMGLPIVAVNPIPGQESRNGDYILEAGAGVKVNSLATLAPKIESLLGFPERLGEMARRAKAAGHPHSAQTVARECLALARKAASNQGGPGRVQVRGAQGLARQHCHVRGLS